ncbi:MAG: restriction endonuclease subunit S [Desulfotalea sp.]
MVEKKTLVSDYIPEIRFEGFDKKWDKKKLGQVLNLGSSKRIHRDDYVSSGIPFFRGLEISKLGKSSKLENVLYISKESYLQLKERFGVPQIGDILITAVGTLGNSFIVVNSEPFYFKDGNLIWLSDIKINNEYLNTYIGNGIGQQRILDSAAGSNQKALTMVNLKNVLVVFPNKNEQTKIGNYFQQLDTLISQHQQKQDKLLNLKKSLLEKMFPKQGADVPEIRFKGFSEVWVEKELAEVSNRYDNLRVPVTATDRVPGATPYYGANGIQDFVEGYTHDGEFVLVAEDGANDLKNYPVQYVNGKIWVNNHAHVIQVKEKNADNFFLKLSISNIDIEPFLVGGGRAKLNAEVMMKIVTSVTVNGNEQTKIGKLFNQLDTLINQHQSQLKKLNNIKQACLAKMFV